MTNLNIGENLLMLLLVVWTMLWKCYSVWTAAKNNHKKWFIALIIFNTVGILDMIYIFYIAKKKWSDVKKAFLGIFSVKKINEKEVEEKIKNNTGINYYLMTFKKYAVFKGRASRAEYWYFFLFNIIIAVGLSLIENIFTSNYSKNENTLASIYQLIILIPSIAVAVRRMHDVNKNGWFILIPIYNLILALTIGTKDDNKYGPNPK